MESKYCETCQFFKPFENGYQKMGNCSNHQFKYDKYGDFELEEGMIFESYEDVWFSVGRKFGCIHHKEATN